MEDVDVIHIREALKNCHFGPKIPPFSAIFDHSIGLYNNKNWHENSHEISFLERPLTIIVTYIIIQNVKEIASTGALLTYFQCAAWGILGKVHATKKTHFLSRSSHISSLHFDIDVYIGCNNLSLANVIGWINGIKQKPEWMTEGSRVNLHVPQSFEATA